MNSFLDASDEELTITLKKVNEMTRVFQACGKSEELLVLKAHLIIEHYLNSIIALALPKSKKVIQESSFSRKLMLVDSFMFLEENTINAINIVNRLRNKFAHQLNFKIDEARMKELEINLSKFSAVEKPTHTRLSVVLAILIIEIAYSESLIASKCKQKKRLLV